MHIAWLISGGRGLPDRTSPGEFKICCLLVTIISSVGYGPSPSFGPVVKSKLRSRGPGLVQKTDSRLKELINIIECTTCKRCPDIAENQKWDGAESGLYGG
jgi:hypothetical protein